MSVTVSVTDHSLPGAPAVSQTFHLDAKQPALTNFNMRYQVHAFGEFGLVDGYDSDTSGMVFFYPSYIDFAGGDVVKDIYDFHIIGGRTDLYWYDNSTNRMRIQDGVTLDYDTMDDAPIIVQATSIYGESVVKQFNVNIIEPWW